MCLFYFYFLSFFLSSYLYFCLSLSYSSLTL
jgi:hypothetical protein